MLLGSLLTGKSEFFNNIYSANKPTKQAEKAPNICTIIKRINKKELRINVIDTSGSYENDENRVVLLLGANLILLFFDVSKEKTFNDI